MSTTSDARLRTAAEVSEADRERCLSAFDRRSRADGLGTWTAERVTAPGDLRLYHAVVSRLFVVIRDVATPELPTAEPAMILVSLARALAAKVQPSERTIGP